MGLFAQTVEKATQLYFYDDSRASFRKLAFEGKANVDPSHESGEEMGRAFLHFYELEFPFHGYKNLSASRVILGYGRDIILDPFNILPDDKWPQKGTGFGSSVIRDISGFKRYKLSKQKPPSALWDKLTVLCGIIDIMLVIGILLKVAIK